MQRRGVLGLIGGLLASVGLHPALARQTEEGGVDTSAFAFPVIRVPGADVRAAWERLRAEGKGWPVILGGAESLADVAESISYETRSPADILAAAASLRFPADLKARREKENAEALESLRKRPPDEVAYRVIDTGAIEAGADPETAGRPVTNAEMLKEMEQEDVGPDLGEWPSAIEPYDGLRGLDKNQDGSPRDLFIALLPTTVSAEAMAYLRFGGWNACPPAEHQVAVLRSLHERYGAELVLCTNDVVELRVQRRPATREEALALARDLYLYCNDAIDQGHGTVSAFAADLMASDWWYFWWD